MPSMLLFYLGTAAMKYVAVAMPRFRNLTLTRPHTGS